MQLLRLNILSDTLVEGMLTLPPDFTQVGHRQLRCLPSFYLGYFYEHGVCWSQPCSHVLLLKKYKYTSTKLMSETLLSHLMHHTVVRVAGCSGGLVLDGCRVHYFQGHQHGIGPTCHACYFVMI